MIATPCYVRYFSDFIHGIAITREGCLLQMTLAGTPITVALGGTS